MSRLPGADSLIYRIFVLYALNASSLVAQEEQSQAGNLEDHKNTIVIYGMQPEENQHPTGRSLSISANTMKSYKSGVLFTNDAAFVDKGQDTYFSPSGFVNPNCRARDTKSNEIYLDDIQIFNPYLGVSSLDNFDLRAFGELRVFLGLGPFDLPTINPSLTLQYLSQVDESQGSTFGVDYGKPFGQQTWGLIRYQKRTPTSNLSSKTFLQNHFSDGHFKYYNNNATPYRSDDDFYDGRTHNDQRSYQLNQLLSFERNQQTTKVFTRINQKQQNIPSLDLLEDGGLHKDEKSYLLDVSHSFALKPLSLPSTLTFGINSGREMTETSDQRSISSSVYDERLENSIVAGRVKVATNTLNQKSQCLFQVGQSMIVSDRTIFGEQRTRRQTKDLHCGALSRLYEGLHLNTKFSLLNQTDKAVATEFADRLSQNFSDNDAAARSFFSYGVGISQVIGESLVFLQGAIFQQPSSLQARFGDGVSVRPNPDIKPEKTLHREVGFEQFFASRKFKLTASYFKDDDKDKIIFVPVSVDATKAQNISATEITGQEVNLTQRHQHLYSTWSYAKYQARDLNFHKVLALPGLPEQQAVVQWGWRQGQFDSSIRGRYSSTSYRDYANQISVPAYLVFDFAIYYWQVINWKISRLEASLLINNFTDVRRLPLEVTNGSNQRGYAAYSYSDGQPLPGRTFVFGLALTI